VNGWLAHGNNPAIKMVFPFSEFSIGKALNSLPKSFHPDLPDLKIDGRVAGKFYFFIDMERPRSLEYRFEGKYEPVKILSLGSKIKVNTLKSPFRHTMRTPKGKKITFLVGENNPHYVPLGEIPQSMISAVITAEDGGFFSHKGFSQRAIKDAFAENLEAGRIVRGASTISMQVAKNLFLTRERTFSRKFEETFIASIIARPGKIGNPTP
jgi:membrane peptidoglycan carboxypeptidase